MALEYIIFYRKKKNKAGWKKSSESSTISIMVINWYGEACFKIQSGDLVLLSDPFDSSTGLTAPRFRADVVINTGLKQPVAYTAKGKEDEAIAVHGPGEYEVKGIEIKGWSNKDTAVFTVIMEEMKLCFLGHLTSSLEPAVLEQLAETDILFVPAGGKPYLDQEEIAKIIKKISPKLAVASLFKIPGLKRKADDVKDFLKAADQKSEAQEKLTIKKKDLATGTKVVILKI